MDEMPRIGHGGHFASRELRKARQWRQIDLAAHSGLNAIYVCDVERGEKQLCLFAIQKLAEGFSISISELFRDL